MQLMLYRKTVLSSDDVETVISIRLIKSLSYDDELRPVIEFAVDHDDTLYLTLAKGEEIYTYNKSSYVNDDTNEVLVF